MYKIAVIGDRDSVYGFAALGLDTYFVTEPQEIRRLIKKLESEKYAVIYITEQLAESVSDQLQKFDESPLPAIILIPGVYGNTGRGMSAVNKSVIKAVGSNI